MVIKLTGYCDANINSFNSAVSCIKSDKLKCLHSLDNNDKRRIREIRLYAESAVMLSCDDGYFYLKNDGTLSRVPSRDRLVLSQNHMQQIFTALCDYSVYSQKHEIASGYITLRGGHRAGICGTAVINPDGSLNGIKDISMINIRIARQIFGCADRLIHIFNQCSEGIIIAGPPCSGKTTVLRDMARQLSSGGTGKILTVAVADERSEIGAVKNGVCQNDLGYACSCLDGYPKHIAIEQAVRCLSPSVIVCDEISTSEQAQAVSQGFNSGVRFIVSVHAKDKSDLTNRSVIRSLIETNAFSKAVILGTDKHVGEIQEIYDINDLGKDNRNCDDKHLLHLYSMEQGRKI